MSTPRLFLSLARLQSLKGVAYRVALLSFVAPILIGCGRFSHKASDGSDSLGVFCFDTCAVPDAKALVTVVLQNNADSSCRIVGMGFRTADTNEEIVGTVLRKSSGDTIESGSTEHFVVQLGRRDRVRVAVKVDFELGGRKWYSCSPQGFGETRPGRVFPDKDLRSLSMYVNSGKALDVDELQCTVNGRAMNISGVASVPVGSEQFVTAVQLTLDGAFCAGDRLFVKLRAGEQTTWCATTKLFHQFSVGTTQYDQVVRPVLVDHKHGSVTLVLYNEADYRKSPALLQRVVLNGDDVTHKAVLPTDALPPDLHNFEEDLRDVIVNVASDDNTKRHKYEILFKRLPPLRDFETPDGYFDVQSFSFETQLNVPFPIGCENGWGFPGAACVFQGGLRPRPELREIIQRCAGVHEVDPSIPVYACASLGTRFENLLQMAVCGDFLVTGKPVMPEDESKSLRRSDRYFRSLEQMADVPGAWIASIFPESGPNCTSPEDLQWQAWACVASGSHGLWLTAPSKGSSELVAACEREAQVMKTDLKNFQSFLSSSVPVALPVGCPQKGVRIESLFCGANHLLIFVFNQWSSCTAYQGDEPFNAAIRQNLELTFPLPEQWKRISLTEPLSESSIGFTTKEGNLISTKLPQFNNVQLLLVSHDGQPAEAPKEQNTQAGLLPFIFESSPVIDLGRIGPASSHNVEFSIRSQSDHSMSFTAVKAGHERSRKGEFSVGDNCNTELTPGDSTIVPIAYTAPNAIGDSITNSFSAHLDFIFSEFLSSGKSSSVVFWG